MVDVERAAADMIDVAIRLHRELGPGLLESVYETVLAATLTRLGYEVQRQLPISFAFDGMRFEDAFRVDLLIGRRLVVELKSVERLNAAHMKQLLTYLRLSNRPIGLLINFGGATLRRGSAASSTATPTSRLRVFA